MDGCVKSIIAFFNPCSWLLNGDSLELACDAVHFRLLAGVRYAELSNDEGRDFNVLAVAL